MKCIRCWEFLISLGNSVDKTISPREDNLIIKIFIVSFFFASLNNLISQSNLQIINKKRIQFEIK